MEKTIKELFLAQLGLWHNVHVRHSEPIKLLQYFLIVIDDNQYTITDERLQELGAEAAVKEIVDLFNKDRRG